MALVERADDAHARGIGSEQEGAVMTSEHISNTAEGKQVAVPQDATLEVEHPGFHYDDRARMASYRRTAPRPPAAPAGAVIALLVGVMVVYSEWSLFAQGYQSQTEADWALGFIISRLPGRCGS